MGPIRQDGTVYLYPPGTDKSGPPGIPEQLSRQAAESQTINIASSSQGVPVS